eukprot:s2733_g10.t1
MPPCCKQTWRAAEKFKFAVDMKKMRAPAKRSSPALGDPSNMLNCLEPSGGTSTPVKDLYIRLNIWGEIEMTYSKALMDNAMKIPNKMVDDAPGLAEKIFSFIVGFIMAITLGRRRLDC